MENLLTLVIMKLLNKDSIHLIRGNHEHMVLNLAYGFADEVLYKYDLEVLIAINDVFNLLPIYALVNNMIFVTHGGLGSPLLTFNRIRQLNRLLPSWKFHSAKKDIIDDCHIFQSFLWSGNFLFLLQLLSNW